MRIKVKYIVSVERYIETSDWEATTFDDFQNKVLTNWEDGIEELESIFMETSSDTSPIILQVQEIKNASSN